MSRESELKWLEDWMKKSESWHKWFAWHPVRVNGKWVWLKHIERIGHRMHTIHGIHYIWEYR